MPEEGKNAHRRSRAVCGSYDPLAFFSQRSQEIASLSATRDVVVREETVRQSPLNPTHSLRGFQKGAPTFLPGKIPAKQ